VLTLGGPAHSSEVLGTYLYKNAFNLNRMGYASAIAVVLLGFTVTLSFIQLRLQTSSTRAQTKDVA
jgi:raffinose/stachyose/melibiose transport system permease protein